MTQVKAITFIGTQTLTPVSPGTVEGVTAAILAIAALIAVLRNGG